MAKDRFVFLLSLACLGLLCAFLFRGPSPSVEAGNPSDSDKNGVKEQIRTDIVEVMVAQQALNVGDRLEEGKFSWEKVDSGDPNPTLIIRNPGIEKKLFDAVTIRDIPKGERIKRLDIVWPEEAKANGNALILSLEPGYRAISFYVKDGAATLQFLEPGMYVDVIFTSKSDVCFDAITVTLLKNIRILGLGQTQNVHNTSQNPSTKEILLEMSSRQAELFCYAQQAGVVALGLLQDEKASDPSRDQLVQLLAASESAENFRSILVTHIIRSLFPHVNVKVIATAKGFIVSGRINENQIAEKIKEILLKLAPDEKQAMVDLMDVAPQQVLLCVRLMEVDKEVESRLGINWKSLYQNGSESVALAGVFPRPQSVGAPDPNYFLDAQGIQSGKFTLSAIVDMLKEKGCGKVIAEPNLSTISGQTAHFFAGGEFPILIPQGGGGLVGSVTVEFKKFGVILEFTPFVDINGLITLHIVPEVSTIDEQNSVKLQGFIVPSLITRRAETTVKLWPGQCYAIAGLLKNDRVSKVYSLYGLNRLPIIGPLFNSKRFVEKRSELMIVITPYLINDDDCMYDCSP